MKLTLGEQEAERQAEIVIGELQSPTLPICPITIARSKEILVEPKDSDASGVSGFLMFSGNTFGIGYATHIQNEGFIRFTVAHELGHYFIPGHCDVLFPDGGGIHQSKSGYISHDPYEREADVFATALLMPETYFTKALTNAGEGFAAIQFLAGTFNTSITSTALRYIRFVDDPVAVIMSTGTQIDYCFMSSALEQVSNLRRPRKGAVLPPRSLTAKFNLVRSNITLARTEGGYTSLDDWFDDAPEIEMKEDVVGLGSYGRTLTILFTSEAIDVEEDDISDDDD